MKNTTTKLLFAFMAIAILFTACETTETDPVPPTITFKAGTGLITADATIKVGEKASFSWEVMKGDAKLQEFTIRINNADVPGFPNEDIDKDEYQDTWDTTLTDAGTYTFSFIAEDKDGETASENITVTVEAATTPLGAEQSFTLTYKSSSQSDGLNKNETVGIEYDGNISGNEAKFATISGDFVMIDASKYTSITTKEGLMEEFEAGTVVEDFTANSDANFSDIYFISKVSDAYFLVHMTDLRFAAGNNQADFLYKM